MRPGIVIGGLMFIGGSVILWSLLSPKVNMSLMVAGLVFLVIAFVMFVRELMKI